jgi:hypothetical protein
MRAFWDLHTCRKLGVVAGPIPWTATEQYARSPSLELSEFEIEMLHEVIRYADDIWLEFQNDQMNKTKRRSKGRK